MSKTLKQIQEIAGAIKNPFLEKAIAQNKPVVGYFCSYVPEEILHAAGFVPYRMRAVGSTGTARGDTYFTAVNCSFVRRCFDQVLNGEYDFLAGAVVLNGCDHSRRIYDNWRDAKKSGLPAPEHLFMLVAPHVLRDSALARYEKELEKIIQGLENACGTKISPKALKDSFALYQKRQELVEKLYALRRQDIPAITGAEMLSVLMAITAVPVEDAISLLTKLVAEVEGRRAASADDIRLMLVGGCMEEPEHIALIEENPAVVVADSLCYGARMLRPPQENEPDEPVAALARRYLYHPSCPRMINDFERRKDAIFNAFRESGADAIIAEKLMFCDLWGGEIFLLRKEAKERGIPFLGLEREMYGGGEGQIRTRVQAFIEQVQNARARNGQGGKKVV
jgi:benzoyl-CoA reductase/2-hydroxyglutaryl-CoA dehydratase subunit BcrC/BadD/HgdB